MRASFTDGASTLSDLDGLRRVCAAMVASPQFLLTGLQPKDGSAIPGQAPAAYGYQALCSQVAAPLLTGISISCSSGRRLTVNLK